MPNFGRREAPDPRDANFPMRRMLHPLMAEFFPRGIPPGSRHYFAGKVLDQGATGTCVAHAWCSKVNAAPIMQKMSVTPYDFYRRIVTVDEWPDNDFESVAIDADLQGGTSVRAGAKVLTDMGFAQSYVWAQSAEDVRAWILSGFGGIVFGTDWKSGMMQTDTEGFISATGGDMGGHAWYLNGWNDRVKYRGRYVRAGRGQQSWGPWGQKGRFWILEDDIEKLIQARGEACALTEQRLK